MSPSSSRRRKAARPTSPSSTSSAAAGARSSATSTRARSTTSCPAWRPPSSTSASSATASSTSTRSSSRAASRRPSAAAAPGRRINELIKPGQEILVQVVKDPLKTKGARLSMNVSIAGRYLVFAPQGSGVGVSRRLTDSERDRLRKMVDRTYKGPGGLIVRTAAHGAKKSDFVREIGYLQRLNEVLRAAQRDDQGAVPGLPGGRPLGAGAARRLPQRVREGDHRLREAVRAGHQLLPAHGAGAGRRGRALQGLEAAAGEMEDRRGDRVDPEPPRRPALGRLPDHRLHRGADRDRRQQRLASPAAAKAASRRRSPKSTPRRPRRPCGSCGCATSAASSSSTSSTWPGPATATRC